MINRWVRIVHVWSYHFIKSWKTSAVRTTVWMVETQLCKLRGTSDILHKLSFARLSFEKRQVWVQPCEWLKLNFASCVVHQTCSYNMFLWTKRMIWLLILSFTQNIVLEISCSWLLAAINTNGDISGMPSMQPTQHPRTSPPGLRVSKHMPRRPSCVCLTEFSFSRANATGALEAWK